MPRTQHRQRKTVSVGKARLLPLLGFRYSTTRDAYVLRGIGNHFGPVYQIAVPPPLSAPTPVEADEQVSA